MKTRTVDLLKAHLVEGQVYRRSDLEQWTTSVDRHLKELQKDNILRKISGGLYACTKKTVFGDVPPSDELQVKSFLKDSRFLIFSPSVYNGLNIGATQLYNETLVYNYKRSGHIKLGSRTFHFVKKAPLPEKLSEEYLLVDLVGRLKRLAEDHEMLRKNILTKIRSMDKERLKATVKEYGGKKARNFFETVFQEGSLRYGY